MNEKKEQVLGRCDALQSALHECQAKAAGIVHALPPGVADTARRVENVRGQLDALVMDMDVIANKVRLYDHA